jgi:DNA mismatch repair protein MutL
MQAPAMSIQILPAEVVDQIAAGEVVERPSHLVKEIVENSLDAGATRVHIEFSDGGRTVKVTDNGQGLSPEDLPKALDRFATSKISVAEDLWKLKTFGFRGEALASISAVSHLTLTSRPADKAQAYQLVSAFGKRQSVDPIGGSPGTAVTIERLFENIPARLKFLKSDAAEHTAIKNTLKALALSHFDVEFKVQEAGRLVSYWPVTASRLERVQQILEIKPLYEGTAQRENVWAHAVFADPHTVAKTSKNIWLFAQNRWIQDRSLQAAVMEAYRHLLMHGEFPMAVVWVETDPDFIDVNIHPTKSQVKFQDPSLAFRAVQASLRDALEKAPWLKAAERQSQKTNYALPNFSTQELKQPTVGNFSFQDHNIERAQFARKDFGWSAPQSTQGPQMTQVMQTLQNAAESRLATETNAGFWSALEVLGQANQTYIICQARDRIVFVDQHAAHERVVFEKLMSAWRGGKIDIQEQLIPLAIDLSQDKVEALLQIAPDLEKLGVFIELLGPGTIGVKAAPLFIKDSILSKVLDQVSTEMLEQGGSYSLERAVGDICATMACHSVVRAGQTLSIPQMQNLLEEMDQFPLSSFCPHGRPVSVDYPFYKLEKDFGRIS